MPLVVESSERERWTILVLDGTIDSQTAPALLDAIEGALVPRPERLALDLRSVEYISSAGLRVLLKSLKAVRRWEIELRLLAPSPKVHTILEVCGFTKLFGITDDLEADAD